MKLTEKEFNWIVEYMHNRYGIELGHKRVLIEGRLENYLLKNSYTSDGEFINRIASSPDGEEAGDMINILTTNHTFFMREFMHFEYLSRYVLPWIREKKAGTKDVRIWSAAASTGEEPYTIAMILNDYFGMEPGWDTQLLATDISMEVLQKASDGIYLTEQIESIPDRWKRQYFRKINDEQFQVSRELRKQIVFKRFNLMDDIMFKGRFQVVFLRNVMIYFEDQTKLNLLKKIYDHMEDGGYLFIGTTESIDKISSGFKYIQPSIYRKM